MPVERTMVLRLMDRAWQNHIDVMSKLREGIHLRSYAQNNPLQAYVEEGYELFENMMNTISNDVVTFCNILKVVLKEKQNMEIYEMKQSLNTSLKKLKDLGDSL